MISDELKLLLIKQFPNEIINDLENSLLVSRDSKIRVVNTGLLKAGKSTLFNCLIDSHDNSYFPTGDTRTTIASKEFMTGNLILSDTPGIDCNSQDNLAATKTLKQSDIVLFVHNMNTGELDNIERIFLEEVAEHWDNKSDFLGKAIFVLTSLDRKEGGGAEEVTEKVRRQINSIFGNDANLISVSSTRYHKGRKENKHLLVEKSNILTLKKSIDEKANSITHEIKSIHQKRIQKIIREMESQLNEQMSGIKKKLFENKQQIKNSQVALSEQFIKLSQNLKMKINHYNSI